MNRAAVFLVVATTIVGTSFVARAKEGDAVERARTFFNAGAQAYGKGEYRDAARSFEQAQELAPRPQLLFSLAQAERKEFFASNDVGFLKKAILHYKTYLEQVASGGRRTEATETKADLEARLARIDPQQAAAAGVPAAPKRARLTIVSSTPTAHVSVDNGAPEELPYFGDLEPGKHKVRVFADGYFDEEREVSGDKPIDLPLDLPLRDRPALVTVAVNRASEIYVDGRIVATGPTDRAIEIPPGLHIVSVSANGKRLWSQELALERGKKVRVEPRFETSGQRVVAWSLLGVGVASFVTGGVFAGLALAQEGRASTVEDARATGNIDAGQLQKHNDAIARRDDFRTVSIVGLSAGVLLAAGGVALFVFDRPTVNVVPPRATEPTPPREPKGTSFEVGAAPILGPGLAGGALIGTF